MDSHASSRNVLTGLVPHPLNPPLPTRCLRLRQIPPAIPSYLLVPLIRHLKQPDYLKPLSQIRPQIRR
jgi:hypothetical protein